MLESKVKSLVALIRGGRNVMEPLFFRERCPLLVPRFVPPDIVNLGQDVQDNVHAENSE
jgi:hypothetical protein